MNVQWDVAPESAEAGPHDEANGAAASSAEPNRHAAVQAIASAAAAASTGSSSSSTSKSPETLDRLDAQLATAAKHKEEGNAHFASGNVTGAMTSWHFALLNSSGINALASTYGGKNTEEHTKRAQSITVAAQNNLASVYLTQGKYEKVVYATTKVLGLDEKNIKALYRRAKARLKLGQVKKAAEDVDKALEIDGKDAGITALAQEIVLIEERKLAESRRKMGGFLKGRILGSEGQLIGEIEVSEPPEQDDHAQAQPHNPPAHGHQCGPAKIEEEEA